MRRRTPPAPEVAHDVEVPWLVMRAGRTSTVDRAMRAAGLPAGMPAEPEGPWWEMRRAQIEQAQAWCAERGLSYRMTAQGSARPSAGEVAAGCVAGAGADYLRAAERRAGAAARRAGGLAPAGRMTESTTTTEEDPR